MSQATGGAVCPDRQPGGGHLLAVEGEACRCAVKTTSTELSCFERRAALVAAAGLWLGTPYVHQASCRGAGADCLGLVRGIWRELIGPEPEQAPAYSADWSEAGGEERLFAAALRHLRLVERPGLGSVLLFRMRPGAVAKHLGIVSRLHSGSGAQATKASSEAAGGPAGFIHAYSGMGVVESSMSQAWSRHLVAVFDFPWVLAERRA